VSTNRIEKQVLLHAPLERVWRAITDSEQFGRWFGVALDGPFAVGARTTGKIVPTTVDPEIAKLQRPHEGRPFEVWVEKIEPPLAVPRAGNRERPSSGEAVSMNSSSSTPMSRLTRSASSMQASESFQRKRIPGGRAFPQGDHHAQLAIVRADPQISPMHDRQGLAGSPLLFHHAAQAGKRLRRHVGGIAHSVH